MTKTGTTLRLAASALAALAFLCGSAGADDRKQQEAFILKTIGDRLPSGEGTAGACFIWGDRAVMLAPDTTKQALMDILATMPNLPAERYQYSNSRWTSTATNGATTIRTPITITWSIVPDGTSVPGFNGEATSNSTLFASMDAAFASQGGRNIWLGRFRDVFTRISDLTAIDYVEVTDDGAAFGSTPGSNTPGSTRGDVRISMHPIDGSSNVLAYNFFPTNGDMVFDENDTNNFRLSTNQHRFLRNVLAHEHGHGLGYNHVDPINFSKLMEAFLATNFDGPQQDDIRGFQFVYGDTREANNTIGAANLISPVALAPSSTSITNLSIETSGAQDFYRVSLPAFSSISVTVTPVGTTYSQGSQGGSTSSVNALTIHNLRLRVIAPNQSTVIADVDATAAGSAESVANLDLSSFGAGDFYIRVDSSTAVSDVQRYQMTLSYTENPPTSASDAWLNLE